MKATAVTGECAVAADDPVAGDDDGNWIGAVGRSNRANGGGRTDQDGDLGIRRGLSGWNLAQCIPHALLERSPVHLHRDPVDGLEVTVEVAAECVRHAARILSKFHGFVGIPPLQGRTDGRIIRPEVKQADPPVPDREGERINRSVDSGELDHAKEIIPRCAAPNHFRGPA